MRNEKRFLRTLKRDIKRIGNRKRRRFLKNIGAAPEDFDLGRDRTDVMNERPHEKQRRWDRSEDTADILFNTSSQSSLECSPPCHGGDRRFKSDRGRFDSEVRKLAKRRSSNLRGLWVRLPPVLLNMRRLGIGKPKSLSEK